MKNEERQQRISEIMASIRPQIDDEGIDIHLWLVADTGKPGEPDFEEWLKVCTRMVDSYEQATGKKDRDSSFASFVREYGRR